MIRGDDRKYQFKKQSDLENGRRRREETSTQLRKAKREEQLMKRRQAPQAATPASMNSSDDDKKVYTKNDIPELMLTFTQGNAPDDKVLKTLMGFRRMLSVETNPPVNEVLDAGALPVFASLLNREDHPTMMFEAAWTLTNIASTEKTREVVNAGITPQLIKLLVHQDAQLREQAAWCLGNIAGDSSDLRDMVLKQGALSGLIMNLSKPDSMSLLSNATWALSNLCRGKPSPLIGDIEPAIGPLATLLRRDVTDEVLVDALWALSYLADGENDRIETIMRADPNIAQLLVDKIPQSKLSSLTPLVRTLGNFVTGTDEQTQAVVDAGIIKHMPVLLAHTNKNIRKESCWLMSNIAAGSKSQIEAVLKEPGLMEQIVHICQSDRFEVKKEGLWVVSNVITTGDDHHIRALVQREGFAVLIEALNTVKEPKMILVVLEAIEAILKLGEQHNLNYSFLMDEYNGIDYLEDLQNHENESVYEKSVELLERYFGVEDEDDENIAPQVDNGVFAFGMAKQLFTENETDNQYAASGLGPSNAPFNFDSNELMEH